MTSVKTSATIGECCSRVYFFIFFANLVTLKASVMNSTIAPFPCIVGSKAQRFLVEHSKKLVESGAVFYSMDSHGFGSDSSYNYKYGKINALDLM